MPRRRVVTWRITRYFGYHHSSPDAVARRRGGAPGPSFVRVDAMDFKFPPSIRVEPRATRYSLLAHPESGAFLCAGPSGGCEMQDRPGDEGLWATGTAADAEGGTVFTNAVTGLVLRSAAGL